MILYSIGIGAICTGVVLAVFVAVRSANAVSDRRTSLFIFKNHDGIQWPTVFIASFGNICIVMGIWIAVTVGMRPIHVSIVIISSVVIFAYALMCWYVISDMTKSKNKEQTKPYLNDPFFSEAVPMGILDLKDETPELKGAEKR
jgi:hypothetical protein